jgi:CheY-like chemotaxis protein
MPSTELRYEPSAEPAAVVRAGPRRGRALVADDDPTARLILKALLSRLGYEIVFATDGREAVARFEADALDIVFLDVNMPHMDGLQAAARIKALCKDDFVPVLFVAGTAETHDLVRGMEAGGDDFLTKPFDEAVLSAKIRAFERIRSLHRNAALLHARERADWQVAQSLLTEVLMGANPRTSALHVDVTPADAFSADVFLAEYSPSGDLNLLLGDFTGHGLAAALAALPTAHIFRSMTAKGFAPQQILLEIDRKLREQLPVGKFMAASFVQVSATLERIWVANFGMPDVVVLGPDGVRERIESSALPLGVETERDAGNFLRMVPVTQGDRLLLASDGVHETLNACGEQFGAGRLEDVAVASRHGLLVYGVKDALAQFRGEEPASDDSSLVEVHLAPELFEPRGNAARRASRAGGSAHSSGQWRIGLELHADAMRVTDPVPMLITELQQVPGLDAHRSVLYTVLSELYSNALEHGVLGLSSQLKEQPDGFERYLAAREQQLATLREGWIRIGVVCALWPTGGQLTIDVEDSGEGFDWRAQPQDDHDNIHGRGLQLVRGLCRTLSFEGKGNRVCATFVWGTAKNASAA